MAEQVISSKTIGGYYDAKYSNGSSATGGVQTATEHFYFGYYSSRDYRSTIQFSITNLKNKNFSISKVQLTVVQTSGSSYPDVSFYLTTSSDPFETDGTPIGTYSFNSSSTSTGSPATITIDFNSSAAQTAFADYLKSGNPFYIRIVCTNSNYTRIRITGPNNPSYPDRAPILKITYSENQNFIYYGVNGNWVPCEVYYGPGGSWRQVVPHYGTGGSWQQLGG